MNKADDNHTSHETKDAEEQADDSKQSAEQEQDAADPIARGKLKSADLTVSFLKVSAGTR